MSTAVISPRQLTATMVVSSSNSLETWRASWSNSLGRYLICDGVNDQEEIQAAINALPAYPSGGRVQLLDGQFNIGGAISIRGSLRIEGMSMGSTILRMQNTINTNMFQYSLGTDQYFFELVNCHLVGNSAGNLVSGHGLLTRTAAGRLYDGTVLNVFLDDFREEALHIRDFWGWHITDSILENCVGDGAYLEGDLGYIIGSKIGQNGGRGITSVALLILVDSIIMSNVGSGILIALADNILIGNRFGSNGSGGGGAANVSVGATRAIVMGNSIDGGNVTQYGIVTDVSGTNGIISQNEMRRHTIANILDGGSGNKIYDKFVDLFMDVLAVSATHVRSNQDLSTAIPITFTIDAQPDVPRTLSGHFDSHAQITAYTIVITGVDAKGNTVTETFTEAVSPWDFETVNAYATITSIIMTARTGTGAGDTMDIGITDVLGLSNRIFATSDVYKIKKNNANALVAVAQVNTTYSTYDMAVIGLAGGDDFTIWFRTNLNIVS